MVMVRARWTLGVVVRVRVGLRAIAVLASSLDAAALVIGPASPDQSTGPVGPVGGLSWPRIPIAQEDKVGLSGDQYVIGQLID
jgi:hypothetical protein